MIPEPRKKSWHFPASADALDYFCHPTLAPFTAPLRHGYHVVAASGYAAIRFLRIQADPDSYPEAPPEFVDRWKRLPWDRFDGHGKLDWRMLDDIRGDIYQGFYRGDYCVSCEKSYTKSELLNGKCPVHGTATVVLEEESYFFRLGKYRDAVRSHIESNPGFVRPAERRNEILSRLREELLDLSISRSTFRWGIPLVNDPSHVLWVWFDALSNYISALRRPEDMFERYWSMRRRSTGSSS